MATFTSVCVCLDRSVSSAGVAGRRRAKIAVTLLWESSPVKARRSLIVVSFRVARYTGTIPGGAANRPVLPHERARDRVDVKKDNSIIGDISTARIGIEDAAQFKGRIEIDPTKSQTAASRMCIRFSRQGECDYHVRLRSAVRIAAPKRLTRTPIPLTTYATGAAWEPPPCATHVLRR